MVSPRNSQNVSAERIATVIVRWFEAIGISVLLGVAYAKTESLIILPLFLISLVPPFLFSTSAVITVLDGFVRILGKMDETILPASFVTGLHLLANVLGALILIIIWLVVQSLVQAEFLGD